MNKQMAYRERCNNEDQVRNLGLYLDQVNYKWFNNKNSRISVSNGNCLPP